MLKNILLLATVLDNIFIITKPPGARLAYVSFDFRPTDSVTWQQLDRGHLKNGVPIYTIRLNHTSALLHYKVHFVYRNSSVTSSWEIIQLKSFEYRDYNSKNECVTWILIGHAWLTFIFYIATLCCVIKLMKNAFRKPAAYELVNR